MELSQQTRNKVLGRRAAAWRSKDLPQNHRSGPPAKIKTSHSPAPSRDPESGRREPESGRREPEHPLHLVPAHCSN